MIGQQISPVLVEIEETLWEFEAHTGNKPNYTDEGFRGAVKIFTSAIMDRVWELQEKEKFEIKDRESMVNKLGTDIRKLVKTYTNIDTFELYKIKPCN